MECAQLQMGTMTIAEDPCNGIAKFDYRSENDYFHYRRRENAYFPLRTRTVSFARSEGITLRRRP